DTGVVTVAIANSGNGGSHDHTPDPLGIGKAQDALGALDGRTDDRGRIFWLLGDDDGGDMHHRLDILHGGGPTCIVEEVGLDEFEIMLAAGSELADGRIDADHAGSVAHRPADTIAGQQQLADKMLGNETGCAGDQYSIHVVPSPTSLNGYTGTPRRGSGEFAHGLMTGAARRQNIGK